MQICNAMQCILIALHFDYEYFSYLKLKTHSSRNWNGMSQWAFTCERKNPDDENDDDDPAVGQVVVARVRVDDGAPTIDSDDDDREGRDEDVGAWEERNRKSLFN